MSLRRKFQVMLVVAAAGLLAVACFWIVDQRSTLLAEKMQKTKNLVEIPYSQLQQQYESEQSGKISRAEAQRRALENIRAMRYDGGNYFWINDEHPTMIMHAVKPELDGRDVSSFRDPAGTAVFVEFVKAARAPGGGAVRYLWPKPGSEAPVDKLSFVKRFEPWGWVIGTGIYIDDVNDAWKESARKACTVAFACLIPLLLVSLSSSRSILRRMRHMLERVGDMAAGDLTKRIDISSRDEIGELAKSFNDFVDRLHGMIQSIAENAQQVASASEQLSATSQQISANSEETSTQASVVSHATQQVSHNLQGVSTGAGEMTSTIQSIASSAHESAKVAQNAVQTAQSANTTVAKLGDSSAEIGEVIKVITSIAQQTNLLALNATIEAARAGEAGKGFAVVANEVKELAKQTAEATEDISRKISAIQTDTKDAVEAIGAITQVIHHISDLSSTIATAVEQQSATTNEMTRNVGDAARGSEEITRNIEGVAEAARGTSASAQESQKAADDLAEMASRLRVLLEEFKTHGSKTAEHSAFQTKSLAASSGR